MFPPEWELGALSDSPFSPFFKGREMREYYKLVNLAGRYFVPTVRMVHVMYERSGAIIDHALIAAACHRVSKIAELSRNACKRGETGKSRSKTERTAYTGATSCAGPWTLRGSGPRIREGNFCSFGTG